MSDLVETARHEMTIFDRPSRRTAVDMIHRIEKLEAALRIAQPFVEQSADENQDGAVSAMMLVKDALETP